MSHKKPTGKKSKKANSNNINKSFSDYSQKTIDSNIPNLEYAVNSDDNNKPYDIRFNFLNAAITDISGYIKHSDNKVYIILTAHGVIIAGLFSSLTNFISLYQGITLQWQRCVIWVTILLFLILTSFFYKSAIWTLLARKGSEKGKTESADKPTSTAKKKASKKYADDNCFKVSNNSSSLWFINKPKDEYTIEQYLFDFSKASDSFLIDNMAIELYKLNDINLIKMKYANKTIKCFIASIIFVAELVLGLLLY